MKILSSLLLTLIIPIKITFSQEALSQKVMAFMTGDEMVNASSSIMIYDLTEEKTVAEFDANRSLPTASTAKLLSTGTALEILGPDYRAKTRLYIDGIIEDGILRGNIWIRGGGDPSLGSKYFNQEGKELHFMRTWVDSLKSRGIDYVQGGVIADASEFGYEGAPDGWNWVDMGNYYGAGPSGLTVYDNLLRYTFASGNSSGSVVDVISIEPDVPGLVYHNYVKASTRKGDHAFLYGAPFSYERFGSGTIPINQARFLVKGSLPDPEWQCAYEFTRLLEENGIEIGEQPKGCREMEINTNPSDYQKRVLIGTHEGNSLEQIITETNHRSINLFAEHMLNLIGFEETGDGRTTAGIQVFDAFWKNKINTTGLHLNDGSGLSRTNAISANHFIEFLTYMHSDATFAKTFRASLPVAGQSGTMRYICRNQAGHGRISAKSGSMTRIRSYAGYVSTATGKELAFAIIVNNYDGSSSSLKNRFQQLMNAMASY